MGFFKKATKKGCKLRLALFGVSGGGKTYSALRLAAGLGGKIALIDTEHGSASKYADRFEFDVCDCDKPTISNILMIVEQAKDYDVLIIDSLTHAWLELIQEVERVARTKFGGNTWSAWSEGTPKQNKLINALLEFNGHIIVTMRAETNWTTTTNDKGKVVPVRIGEAPKQGKNIEYEFDMLIQLSQEHNALVLKDRTGKYQDQCIDLIDEKFGEQLGEWLDSDEVQQAVEEEVKDVKLKSAVGDPIVDLNDDDMIEEFKKRTLKILTPQQCKLFMKKFDLSVKNPQSLREFFAENDLELTLSLFEEEIGR